MEEIFQCILRHAKCIPSKHSTLTQRWYMLKWRCDVTMLIPRRFLNVNSSIKFNIEASLKKLFSYHDGWKINIFINIEKITICQRRSNFSLSILNQCRNLMSKQRWFWVDPKKQFHYYIMLLYKTKLFIFYLVLFLILSSPLTI